MILNKINFDKNVVLQYLFILYAFCIPISRAGISAFTVLILVMWLFSDNLKEDIKYIIKNNAMFLFVIFILYNIVSLFWSTLDLDESINYIKRYWFYIPLFVIATKLEYKNIKYVLTAFLLGMFISEIISYGIFFQIINFKNVLHTDPSPFMNHLQYSAFIVFTSLYVLNKIFFEKKIINKIIYALFFITVTANLFINGGRIGYIAFFITIFLVLFLNIKNKIKFMSSFILLCVLIFGLAYNYSSTFKTRLSHTKNELKTIAKSSFHTSFGQRLALGYMAYEIGKNNLIFGVGVGDEMVVLKNYLKKQEYSKFKYLKDRRHFHNIFLQIFVQLGLIGFILILFYFFFLFKIKIKNKYFDNLKYIFLTIFLITCLTGNMFHQQFTMALFALIVGILLSIERCEKKLTC